MHYYFNYKIIQKINSVHRLDVLFGHVCCNKVDIIDILSLSDVEITLISNSLTNSLVLFAGAPTIFISAWVITKVYLNDSG